VKPGSLRFRLLASAVVSVAGALVLSAVGLQALFGHHVERQLEVQLETFIGELIGHIEPDPQGGFRLTQPLSDPRFGQPHSGLYWQIQEDAHRQLLRSRSLWDTVLPLPEDELALGVVHQHALPGPDAQSLLVREQQVVMFPESAPRRLRVAVALDRTDLLQARDAFSRDMLPYLLLLGGALLIATGWQIRTGLAPLQHIREGVFAVHSGKAQRLSGSCPEEVQPLIGEINKLLDSRDRAVEDARAWTADLAHGLKTPLAALGADAQRLREKGFAGMADDLDALAQSMRQRVDRELIRARLRTEQTGVPKRADLNKVVRGLVNTLQRTPEGEHIAWDISIPGNARVWISPADATELLGNLLDNAVKWAGSRVSISTRSGSGITIEDDGPGVVPEKLKALGQRGLRLDEQVAGNGLGLAIARDIVDAYQGELMFSRSKMGGLQVDVLLPSPDPDVVTEE
jgi:signal transduction histidine kinase